ncbi:MipA/OmpV family protein [Ewingella americana]|uniref:MipA/OmpV family protein n=1 Tax=Ewingella americana TaxID=41202 RepID=A0A502GSL8_9GAMM|nr:MipA/OmpV family protein [Ewingella americana]TPG64921.1 MipA/OmpV family protein [Ewingella americana]
MKNSLILSISIITTGCLQFSAQAADGGFWGDHTDVSLGAGAVNKPRYSGSSQTTWGAVPLVQVHRGAMFIDSTKGIGYDLPIAGGLYLEHSLGYGTGRTESDSSWRDGSKKLKGMGNIKGVLNTSLTLGYQFSPRLAVEAMTTLPLTDSQGVRYQGSIKGVLWQGNKDEVDLQGDLLFGDHRNNNLFYGVSAQQSKNTSFNEYNAAGGLYAQSATLSWSHQFTASWSTLAAVDYTLLTDKADKSQIVDKRSSFNTTLAVLYTF